MKENPLKNMFFFSLCVFVCSIRKKIIKMRVKYSQRKHAQDVHTTLSSTAIPNVQRLHNYIYPQQQ